MGWQWSPKMHVLDAMEKESLISDDGRWCKFSICNRGYTTEISHRAKPQYYALHQLEWASVWNQIRKLFSSADMCPLCSRFRRCLLIPAVPLAWRGSFRRSRTISTWIFDAIINCSRWATQSSGGCLLLKGEEDLYAILSEGWEWCGVRGRQIWITSQALYVLCDCSQHSHY